MLPDWVFHAIVPTIIILDDRSFTPFVRGSHHEKGSTLIASLIVSLQPRIAGRNSSGGGQTSSNLIRRLSGAFPPNQASSIVMMLLVLLLAWSPPILQAQDFQPEPVSEYVEKSGPNTLTFLSYPKYYSNAEGQLTLVNTNLSESKNADWDFEVTTGIWTLRVKTDGTFQAEHAGNIFTYKLDRIGVGRGENFSAFEWGEPSWKNYQVVGDSIRWLNVFPDVDLVVRYIHDILKVDVIVKASLMNEIRSEVQKGTLDADDYLTARFSIPNVWITTDVQLGNEKVDIYAGSLDLQQPLEFVKDGKVVQKLRPVEAYVLDEKGEPILSFEEDSMIHTAQVWQLNKESAGIAEMSANLGDLADAPDGDVVIDPSMNTVLSAYDDSTLLYSNKTGFYGSNSILYLSMTGTNSTSDRIVIKRGVSESESFFTRKNILSVKLKLYLLGIDIPYSIVPLVAYNLDNNWTESQVNWNQPSNGSSWSDGGMGSANFRSRSMNLPNTANQWIEIDITNSFKKAIQSLHYADGYNFLWNGIIIKYLGDQYLSAAFASSDNGNELLRPQIVVQWEGTQFGAWVGNPEGNLDERLLNIYNDKLTHVRITGERAYGGSNQNAADQNVFNNMRTIVSAAHNRNLKSIIVIPAGFNDNITDGRKGYSTSQEYANYITGMLNRLSDSPNYISSGSVSAIEIGSEEDNFQKGSSNIYVMKWTKSSSNVASETGGREFAAYYLSAYSAINNNSLHPEWKNLQILSGSIEDWKQVAKPDGSSSKDFLRGFIDEVTKTDNFDKVPHAISIHAYGPHTPPEGYFSPDYPDFHRTGNEILSMSIAKQYIPNLAQTEYGYSPTFPESTGLINYSAPLDKANNYTQAIYYLRSRLIQGCMKPMPGVGNLFSAYFIHPQHIVAGGGGISDWSFLNFDTAPGSNRAIRSLSSDLMDTSEGLRFGSSEIGRAHV